MLLQHMVKKIVSGTWDKYTAAMLGELIVQSLLLKKVFKIFCFFNTSRICLENEADEEVRIGSPQHLCNSL